MFSSANGKSAADFSATGTVRSENGRYYLYSSETGMKYEVKGDNLKNYDGTSVVASGLLEAAAPASGVAGILLASSIQSSNAATLMGQSAQTRAIVQGLRIAKPMATSQTTRQCPPMPTVDCCPNVPEPQCCNPLPPNLCQVSK